METTESGQRRVSTSPRQIAGHGVVVLAAGGPIAPWHAGDGREVLTDGNGGVEAAFASVVIQSDGGGPPPTGRTDPAVEDLCAEPIAATRRGVAHAVEEIAIDQDGQG